LRSAEEVLAVVRAVAPKPVNVLMSGGLKLTVQRWKKWACAGSVRRWLWQRSASFSARLKRSAARHLRLYCAIDAVRSGQSVLQRLSMGRWIALSVLLDDCWCRGQRLARLATCRPSGTRGRRWT
jgi:hypothetical protein